MDKLDPAEQSALVRSRLNRLMDALDRWKNNHGKAPEIEHRAQEESRFLLSGWPSRDLDEPEARGWSERRAWCHFLEVAVRFEEMGIGPDLDAMLQSNPVFMSDWRQNIATNEEGLGKEGGLTWRLTLAAIAPLGAETTARVAKQTAVQAASWGECDFSELPDSTWPLSEEEQLTALENWLPDMDEFFDCANEDDAMESLARAEKSLLALAKAGVVNPQHFPQALEKWADKAADAGGAMVGLAMLRILGDDAPQLPCWEEWRRKAQRHARRGSIKAPWAALRDWMTAAQESGILRKIVSQPSKGAAALNSTAAEQDARSAANPARVATRL